MKTNEIQLTNTPQIEGLWFRKFAGDSDFPNMLAIIEAEAKADHDERAITLEDIRNDYAHLTNSVPERDMILAEVNGETIAYSRTDWYQEEDPNDRIYSFFVFIKPEWREKGIEEPMLHWCEDHLRKTAQSHPQDSKRFFQAGTNAAKSSTVKLFETQGYKPVRYGYEMARPLENIPPAALPDGIEARPVDEKDIRKIWNASIEAFRDHWGFSPPTEEDFDGYLKSKYFQPELWQVAWDGDKIVGSVLNYIDHDYNEKYHKMRGYTEEITTHRDYRRQGIAKALIVRSMHMHKAKGMTEVALGVDTENPNGALQLYESLGYRQEKTWITFRKPL